MTLIQKYFVPEDTAEAKKWTIYRLVQVTAPSDAGRLQHQMGGRPLPLHVLCLSLHAETLSHRLW